PPPNDLFWLVFGGEAAFNQQKARSGAQPSNVASALALGSRAVATSLGLRPKTPPAATLQDTAAGRDKLAPQFTVMSH
ncbi:MAG: hypothetical protein WCJ55_17760, partial [Chloroflexales bacterium]